VVAESTSYFAARKVSVARVMAGAGAGRQEHGGDRSVAERTAAELLLDLYNLGSFARSGKVRGGGGIGVRTVCGAAQLVSRMVRRTGRGSFVALCVGRSR
jgi:hypothetical protein